MTRAHVDVVNGSGLQDKDGENLRGWVSRYFSDASTADDVTQYAISLYWSMMVCLPSFSAAELLVDGGVEINVAVALSFRVLAQSLLCLARP